MRCRKCGVELAEGAYFCGECGTIVNVETDSQADKSTESPDYSNQEGISDNENVSDSGSSNNNETDEQVCPRCGTKYFYGMIFCKKCGHYLTEPYTVASEPQKKKPARGYIIAIIIMSVVVIAIKWLLLLVFLL